MITYLPADTPADDIPDICTARGKGVWYLEPERTVVDMADVLLHLARVNRYAGARSCNVLEHTALCVRVFDEMVAPLAGPARLSRRYVAAHDLHEAYVLDLPSGLKRRLPEYKERIERPWEAHVHRSLGLAWEPPPGSAAIVEQVDGLALVAEMALLGHPLRDVAAARRGIAGDTMGHLRDIARSVFDSREIDLCRIVLDGLDTAQVDPGAGS